MTRPGPRQLQRWPSRTVLGRIENRRCGKFLWPSHRPCTGYTAIMDTKLAFTVVYETVEDGWTQARIEELPAVITVAPTLDEAKELLLDALREFLLALGHPE